MMISSPLSQMARSEVLFQHIMSELEKGLEISVVELARRVKTNSSHLHKMIDQINLRLMQDDYPKHIKVRRDGHMNHWRLAPRTLPRCRHHVATVSLFEILDEIALDLD